MTVKEQDDQYLRDILSKYSLGKHRLVYRGIGFEDMHVLATDHYTLLIWFDRRENYLDARMISNERYHQMSGTSSAFEFLKLFDQMIGIRHISKESLHMLTGLVFDKSEKCSDCITSAIDAFELEAENFGENIPNREDWIPPKFYEKNS